MWWILSALAAPPDAAPATLSMGTSPTNLGISGDGELVAALSGDSVWVMSVDDWSVTSINACDPSAVYPGSSGVWVACADGIVKMLDYSDGVLSVTDTSFDAGDGDPKGVFEYEGSVGVLMTDADGVLSFTTYTATGTVKEEARELLFDEVEDTALVSGIVYVSHGGNNLSRVPFASGSPTLLPNTVSSGLTFDQLAEGSGGIYAVGGGVLTFVAASFTSALVQGTSLGTVEAFGVHAGASDGWALLVTDQVDVWGLDENGLSDEPLESFDIDETVTEVVVSDDYAFGASATGLVVFTANPWVSDFVATPSSAVEGEEVALTFSVDESVDWSLYLGGDSSGSGTLLGEGVADSEVSTTVTVDSTWAEGKNSLVVVVKDASGNEGHGVAKVTVDNPPDTPVLTDDSLGFGDERLVLSFDGISDEDLAGYDIYVTTVPFESADWATGGPEFDGEDALETPIRVDSSGGQRVTASISPLTNGVTYYVAVRAVDEGGLEGPMSEVVSGTPKPTFAASELSGENGGCSTAPGSLWGAVVGLGVLIGRRRRIATLGAVLVASTAQAGEGYGPFWKRTDLTPTYGNVEVRYGGYLKLDDPCLSLVYGEKAKNSLRVEFGPQFPMRKPLDRSKPGLFGLVELDFGVGLFQEIGNQVDSTGCDIELDEATRGTDVTMMTWLPLSADLTLRLQFMDEQILVPHARFGGDYLLWQEKWDAGGGKETMSGGNYGYHYGFGASFLLDILAPSRAAILENHTGINDTYLVFEWRRQEISAPKQDDGEGFDFSGTEITVGLKLDY